MSQGRVLVVDADSDDRLLFSAVLARAGHTVEAVPTGGEATAAIARESPDLILIDSQLPDVSGVDLCRQLKSDATLRLTPVVLITSRDAESRRIKGIEAGADGFLSKPIDCEELQARVSSLVRVKHYTDQLDSAESIIMTLGRMIDARDGYTQGHCERLACYATVLGKRLGLDAEQLAALHRGAFLHDIGKIGIPDAILLKTTRLTLAEYDQIKQHPVIGEGLCGTLQSLALVRPIVRHHHERLDGSGYPDGLRGAAVPILAQIVSIVDAFDAITTGRSYRTARSPEEAYADLVDEAKAGWRDAALVDSFVAAGRGGHLIPSAVPPPSYKEDCVPAGALRT
jgi:putative two-component system response regulator